jgi:hypothetical protein
MAHFAELNENNVVLRIIVVADSDTSDANGDEKESIGIAFCEKLLGGRWIKTSYNGKIRKRYAAPGMIYLPEHDQFTNPKPGDEYEYNPETGEWIVPGLNDNPLRVERVGE